MEGAPSGLRQEEGEAGGNSPNSPVPGSCPGQEPTSREEESLPAEPTAASMGAGWFGVLQEPVCDGWGEASLGPGLPQLEEGSAEKPGSL